MNFITTQHIKAHGFPDAASFKKRFGLSHLKCPSMRIQHSLRMSGEGNSMFGGHSLESSEKIRRNRKGKGLGVAGKYERTPEIKKKISEGVALAYQANPGGWVGRGKGTWISSKKGGEIWVRSSWEARLVQVLDLHPSVIAFEYEPFRIPYSHGEDEIRNYLPDFLIHLEGGIREIWEVKPAHFRKTPESTAKRKALALFCEEMGFNHREVDLPELEGMEMQVGIRPWVGPGRPWVQLGDLSHHPTSSEDFQP